MLTTMPGCRYHITMHQKYDIALKDIIKDIPRQFLKILTGYDSWQFMDVQFPDIQARQPDIVIKTSDGTIIHIEIQSTNDSTMLKRMYLYSGFIYNQYDVLPIQIVLYIGKKPLNMPSSVELGGIKYAYRLVDIHTINGNQLITGDSPDDCLLAILCKTDDVDGTIKKILDIFYPMPYKERKNYVIKLLYLSELVNLYKKVKAEVMNMPITIDIEDSEIFRDVFMKGNLEGELKGELKGIEGMLDIKYGYEGLGLMDMVRTIGTIDKLDAFSKLIRKSTSIAELRAYLSDKV
ncbi:hypothetical protein [Candidatus Magnetobacterium casense]|uniref:Transposase (putative) YhgA-like domain-containing protein n=1 Tax=Candidatus Magnetobacterium casense TaxID=1455061 RepID=A0ABS6RYJ7_9BACT|nr:hypothetical protein [Candidatus Magnetobacterium casensis]MBV6341714.1 hypothetical protein [Candidatus Magnetobacterium casensis]